MPEARSPDQAALMSWLSLDAPPGWEQLATDVLLKQLPGWKRDPLGNLILRKGSGSPDVLLRVVLTVRLLQ